MALRLKNIVSWNRTRPTGRGLQDRLGIYSEKEFEALIEYERVRADREGSEFSIILFDIKTSRPQKSVIKQFIKELKQSIRAVDHFGWYKNYAAVMLISTNQEKAIQFANNVEARVNFKKLPFPFQVYSYPDHWLKNNDQEINENIENDVHTRIEDAFTLKMPVWKRSLDILGSLTGLLLLSPIFILTSIFIKIVSPGPIFFRQTRVGFKGEEFSFWKFRTMKHGNNQGFHGKHSSNFIKNSDTPMEKLDDRDPRIISGGRILRKTCIDELPQLWNILIGDMSIVGPRPCIPYEAEDYLRWHTHRFDIVPGLTGLWQVSGKNKLTFKQMIRLDIKYSRKMSFLMDIRIIFATFPAIVDMVMESAKRKITEKNNDILTYSRKKNYKPKTSY